MLVVGDQTIFLFTSNYVCRGKMRQICFPSSNVSILKLSVFLKVVFVLQIVQQMAYMPQFRIDAFTVSSLNIFNEIF